MKITINNLQNKIPVSHKEIKRLAETVLGDDRCCRDDASIILTTDKEIRKLNKRFMRKNSATDVLAFSFREGDFSNVNPASLLGDVVVSIDAAILNAKIYKTTPQKELYLYIIHGLLHLLGYDDITPRKRAAMRKKEQYYLNRVSKNQRVKVS